MGIWSWDIIGCDANLELAMDFLDCAGVGPRDYATRRELCKVTMATIVLDDGTEGVFLGRHTAEEYAEFFSVLDDAAHEWRALEQGLRAMLKWANSVQQVHDVNDTPVGHAFHVLALILMQAGVLPIDVADIVLSIPICAASDGGEHNEREGHERRFQEAIRKYKNAGGRVASKVVVDLRPTGAAGDVPVTSSLDVVTLLSGVAVKYAPISWAGMMSDETKTDKPATVTMTPYDFRRSELVYFKGSKVDNGSPEMETLEAQGKVERARKSSMYTREPENITPQVAALVGKRVRVQGLVKKPEYNGLVGTVAAFNHAADRFAVEIEKVGRMALKRTNLVEIA